MDFETINRALGDEIREWRRHRKMSQEKFAEKSNVHMNEVRKLEKVETNPKLETLLLIATGMNLSLAGLFSAVEKRGQLSEGSGGGDGAAAAKRRPENPGVGRKRR